MIWGFFLNSQAQQLPQFTEYMYNTISVNPAYAGSRGSLNIVALGRFQWVGLQDGPNTQTVSMNSPLKNQKIGIGGSVIVDNLGFERFIYAYGDLSYTFKFENDLKCSLGLKAGATYYGLDAEFLADADVANDIYFQKKVNKWNPNMGAGILFHTNDWYVGLSSPRLIDHDYKSENELLAKERLHYYLLGGYVFSLGEKLKFKPSAMVKYSKNTPISLDVSGNFLIHEKLWLGMAYRFRDAVGAMMDLQLAKNLRIGYAYEYPVTDIERYTSGTHEVLMIFEFKFLKNKFRSPRYF